MPMKAVAENYHVEHWKAVAIAVTVTWLTMEFLSLEVQLKIFF